MMDNNGNCGVAKIEHEWRERAAIETVNFGGLQGQRKKKSMFLSSQQKPNDMAFMIMGEQRKFSHHNWHKKIDRLTTNHKTKVEPHNSMIVALRGCVILPKDRPKVYR